MWYQKKSHVVLKKEPYGIEKRAMCYLVFSNKCAIIYKYLQKKGKKRKK